MSRCVVRTAAEAHLDEIAALSRAAAGPTRVPAGAGAASRLLARDPDALLVAVDGTTIVGTLIVGYDG